MPGTGFRVTGVEEEPPPPPPQAAKNSASAPIESLAKIRGNRFDNLRALQGLQQFFGSKLDTSMALFTSLAGTPVRGCIAFTFSKNQGPSSQASYRGGVPRMMTSVFALKVAPAPTVKVDFAEQLSPGDEG